MQFSSPLRCNLQATFSQCIPRGCIARIWLSGLLLKRLILSGRYLCPIYRVRQDSSGSVAVMKAMASEVHEDESCEHERTDANDEPKFELSGYIVIGRPTAQMRYLFHFDCLGRYRNLLSPLLLLTPAVDR